MNRKLLRTTLYAGIGMALATSGAALAQEADAAQAVTARQEAAAADDTVDIERVVVTARRREELLQEVPVAVSALDWQRLERTGAQDLTTLQQQTPNATVQVARGSSSNTRSSSHPGNCSMANTATPEISSSTSQVRAVRSKMGSGIFALSMAAMVRAMPRAGKPQVSPKA